MKLWPSLSDDSLCECKQRSESWLIFIWISIDEFLLFSLYRFSPRWHVIKHTNRRTRPAASHSKKHIGYKNDCEGDETSFWILIMPGPALMTFILLSLPTVTLQYASIPDFFSISRQFWPLNNCPPPLMVAHWAQWLHGTAQHNPI